MTMMMALMVAAAIAVLAPATVLADDAGEEPACTTPALAGDSGGAGEAELWLVTEDEITALPAEYQELLSSTDWFPAGSAPLPAGFRANNDAFRLSIEALLPTAGGGKYYVAQGENSEPVDVEFRALLEPTEGDAAPEITAVIWAFRDGSILVDGDPGVGPEFLARHTFDNALRVAVVTVMVVDELGNRVMLDCLPVMMPDAAEGLVLDAPR